MNLKMLCILLLVGIVTVNAWKLNGDVNKDCYVNILDMGTLNPYWELARGQSHDFGSYGVWHYKGWADLNKDGVIDQLDVDMVANNWGATC